MTQAEPPAPATSTAVEPSTPAIPGRNTKKRKLAVGLLIFFGSLCLLIGIFATWVDKVALDSDNWSDTSTQALEQPAVRTAVSEYLTDQLYANVDVSGLIKNALPPKAQPLSGPIAAGAEPYIQRAVAASLTRPRFVQLWKVANLKAHSELMDVLNGHTALLTTTNGNVVIALGPLVGQFSAQLASHTGGAVVLPAGTGNIVLLHSDQLSAAQTAVKVMRFLAIPLSLIGLLLLAIAVFISRDRRRTLRTCGFALILIGLILVFIRRVVGDALVDALTNNPDNAAAAKSIWWVATDKLASANATVITVGLVAVVGTWFAGAGKHATGARRSVTPYLRDPIWAYGAYGVIILVLLIWAPVDAARTLLTAVVLIVLGAIGVEALRRLVIRENPELTEQRLGGELSEKGSELWEWMKGNARHDRAEPVTVDAGSGRYAELERLSSLHERGVLTDAEFAKEKAALLSS